MSATAGHLTAFTLVCATPDNGTGTVRISATAESVAVDENRLRARAPDGTSLSSATPDCVEASTSSVRYGVVVRPASK